MVMIVISDVLQLIKWPLLLAHPKTPTNKHQMKYVVPWQLLNLFGACKDNILVSHRVLFTFEKCVYFN